MKERLELFIKKLLSIKILIGLPLLTGLLIFEIIPWFAWLTGFSAIILSRETTKIFLSYLGNKDDRENK